MLHRAWRYRLREEKDSIQYLLSQDLKGKTVLDIGANKGIYTYWMSKHVGSTGKVVSFEPQPELGDFLEDLKSSFRLNNVEVVNKGLSSRQATLNLIRKKAGAGGAMLEIENEALAANPNLEKVKVEVTTLDSFFSNRILANLAFIKCDVENHELSVFKGGASILSTHKPDILFECHHSEASKGNIFSFLESLNYTGFFIAEGKKIHYSKFGQYPYRVPTNQHRNYIFTRK
ncbi:MAG: FkbM family methyltransferase [Cyclobacteriaceae bacterium]